MSRKTGVVLLAGEALFLRGGDDLAVAHQAGRAVVVEGGDAQDVRHARSSAGSECRPTRIRRLPPCQAQRWELANPGRARTQTPSPLLAPRQPGPAPPPGRVHTSTPSRRRPAPAGSRGGYKLMLGIGGRFTSSLWSVMEMRPSGGGPTGVYGGSLGDEFGYKPDCGLSAIVGLKSVES